MDVQLVARAAVMQFQSTARKSATNVLACELPDCELKDASFFLGGFDLVRNIQCYMFYGVGVRNSRHCDLNGIRA
jgi:hypothetical protein